MSETSPIFDITEVSAADRAFNYGDACFTTMYCDSKGIQLLEHHLNRLQHDCKQLFIKFTQCDALRQYLLSDKLKNQTRQYTKCAVKILVSRGKGGRGYNPLPFEDQTSVVCVSVHPYSSLNSPLRMSISSIILSSQVALAGLKHANRLEQVLAKQALQVANDALEVKVDDCLMVDENKHIIEASSANVFFFDGNTWLTPVLDKSGVSGVMRNFVLQNLSNLDKRFAEKRIPLSTLTDFKSAFVCNALSAPVSVSSIRVDECQIDFDTSESDILRAKLMSSLRTMHT